MTGEDRKADEAAGLGSRADTDLSRRFGRLSQALARQRAERVPRVSARRSGAAGYGLAVRLGSEFVAAILVGIGLGWGLDRLAGTSPWGLVVFLLLGFAAGVMNVLRAAGTASAPSADADGSEGGSAPR